MDAIDALIDAAQTFCDDARTSENGRSRSWEHCYRAFRDARTDPSPDYDNLSLHLAFYLASWGMYRGSSFLLQKDYKVLSPIVEEVLKPEYDCLFGVACVRLREPEVQARLTKVYDCIADYFRPIRDEVAGREVFSSVSPVLITKILMGTLGCVPAYDRFFQDGVATYKVRTREYSQSGSSHFGVWGWCWHGVGACPMIEVATLQTLGGPDMGNGTFSALDMTTYCGLVELGLVAVGMRCQEGGFVLKCRAVNPARLCPGCGRPGDALGSRTRRLAHEPRGHQPTMLVVYVGRYRCRACSRSWCDDISQAAPPRAKLSFGALRWGLVCLIADNMSINRIAAHLAVAWHTANEAIQAYEEELLLADSTRFEGVRVIGVDEHVWRHRGGDRYATVIVDLTPVRDHTGPARLLDVVQGRSKHVLSSWLAACPQEWKDNIEIVAMDGFSGYKSAAASQLPGAVTVMDPFHVVHIAIDALEQCRQRVQQETLGHRGRKGDPLYAARKTLLTGTDILTDTSQARLDAVFACPDHADVHATWRIYQDLLAAYRDRDPRRGKNTLRQLITTLTRPGLPHTCIELARMGRTFTRRAGDILAYFDHPHTSNGPTEAINGRLEHLRGIAQGFVNHRNYRLRCLLHSGGFQHLLHP